MQVDTGLIPTLHDLNKRCLLLTFPWRSAADRVRCKAAASACKARLKRAEQTAATLRKELADQKKMTELLSGDKSLF